MERMIRWYTADEARVERGAAVLDDLYEGFRGLGA